MSSDLIKTLDDFIRNKKKDLHVLQKELEVKQQEIDKAIEVRENLKNDFNKNKVILASQPTFRRSRDKKTSSNRVSVKTPLINLLQESLTEMTTADITNKLVDNGINTTYGAVMTALLRLVKSGEVVKNENKYAWDREV